MKAAALVLALAGLCVAQDQPPVDWIRSHAVPLDTVDPGNGFADLQALKKTIGNARIVSLGEATHGTREFFRMKHRMLEFLATELGFDIFAIEANLPEAYRLNEYVLTGQGDPAKLLKGMYFWTWNTEEVLEMIRWMREFNATGKGRLQFTGFDMQVPGVAMTNVRDFLAAADPGYVEEADAVYAPIQSANTSGAYAIASITAPAAGRKFRLSGFIRGENIQRGMAGLGCYIYDGSSRLLAYDMPPVRGLKGTFDWQPYEVVVEVPNGAAGVQFGAYHTGDGTAWFDSLSLEVDGVPYPTALDLDFESNQARGFYTGGAGYGVQTDAATARTGRQSLRFRWLGASARDVAAAAASVVSHMESARDAYLASGVSAWDVEWAIQNARIVAQSAEGQYDNVRDGYMARNAQWILDQNPGGRMVIWAHNLHVATGGNEVWPNSMGQQLKEMYGPGLVTFGFAFNQGSFQAIGMAGMAPGPLQEFTVDPAPADTLDGALAATGIPMFVLPFGDSDPAWIRAPQQTRVIGAAFGDAFRPFYPMAAPLAYDAVIFVERTTRARPNP